MQTIISNPKAKHAYTVEVREGDSNEFVRVEANNKEQATCFAIREGYVVRSVREAA